MINAEFTTTAQTLPGYRIARNLGFVRGIIVRSRSIGASAPASRPCSRHIPIYTNLCEKARDDAPLWMVEQAHAARRQCHRECALRFHRDRRRRICFHLLLVSG